MIPFVERDAEQIAALGEVRLISRIRKWLGEVAPPPPHGMGDDCAVLPPRRETRLVTTDSVLWRRHFDASVSPEQAGEKLIKRNLSDIAAMGGEPADAVLSLIMGPDVAVSWLERFFYGVATTCMRYRMTLVGGDVAGAERGFFCATLALTGFVEKPLPRLAARVGDVLLVTGNLGGSLAGKHYLFEPRLAEGRWLAARPDVRAGMDITDGLAKDLSAFLPEGCAAELNVEEIPVAEDAREIARRDGQSPLWHALTDGEDYELLLAATEESVPALLADWRRQFPELPLTVIGRVAATSDMAQAGLLLDARSGLPLLDSPGGYTHF